MFQETIQVSLEFYLHNISTIQGFIHDYDYFINSIKSLVFCSFTQGMVL